MQITETGNRIIVDYEHQQISEEEMLEVWHLVQAHMERLHERGNGKGTSLPDEATWIERVQRHCLQSDKNGK